MRRPKCLECFFFGGRTHSCDYLLLTGHRRGCQPEECDKFKERFDKREIIRKQTFEHSKETAEPMPEELKSLALELYRQGLFDSEIACRLHIYPKQVSNWRKHKGLPSNYLGGTANEIDYSND